jgi:alanine dehydrogenase
MQIRVLSDDDVERLLDLDHLLEALAHGFSALSAGRVSAPPRNGVEVPAGFLLSMVAHAPEHPIGVKLVSVFHGNHRLGLPGHLALISLFDERTGAPMAVMNGTYVTAMRTAGGAALSARLLSRPESRTLAIIGAGVQGAAHVRMLSRVRAFTDIRLASASLAEAQHLAGADARITPMASAEDSVRGADVVCLCTTSPTPVVHRRWLSPGTHVTSVGYMPPGSELASDVLDGARVFVETRLAYAAPPAGCAELSGRDANEGTELGEVLLERRPGRQSADQVTVYKSMGHAVEDLVAAQLVYERATREGAGTLVAI